MPEWIMEGMAYHHAKNDPEKTPDAIRGSRKHYESWLGEKTLVEGIEGAERWADENIFGQHQPAPLF